MNIDFDEDKRKLPTKSFLKYSMMKGYFSETCQSQNINLRGVCKVKVLSSMLAYTSLSLFNLICNISRFRKRCLDL